MNLAPPKPKWLPALLDWAADRFVADAEPRPDAGAAHRFRKVAGKIVVELNPLREKECGQRFAVIEKARLDRVKNAESVRADKLKEAKARHAAELEVIEAEYRNVEATATSEFVQAEQALLAEFAVPPVVTP